MAWSYDATKDGGEASFHGDPLVAGGLVLVGTDGGGVPDIAGHLYAFAWRTGEVRWKYRADNGVATDILRSGSRIYAVSSGDRLDCLDLKSGTRLWTFPTDVVRPRAEPATTQPGKVAAAPPRARARPHSADDVVEAAPTEHVGPASLSPVLVGKRVVFATAEGRVYAVDAVSGRLQWERDLSSPITTDLASVGDALYVGTNDRHLYRLLLKSGAVAANVETPQRPFGKPVVAGSSLVVLLTGGAECCDSLAGFDLSLTRRLWIQPASGGPLSTTSSAPAGRTEVRSRWTTIRPRLWRGLVLAGSDQGVLAAVRPSDGSWAWSRQLRGWIRGIGDDPEGRLYIGTVGGKLFVFRP